MRQRALRGLRGRSFQRSTKIVFMWDCTAWDCVPCGAPRVARLSGRARPDAGFWPRRRAIPVGVGPERLSEEIDEDSGLRRQEAAVRINRLDGHVGKGHPIPQPPPERSVLQLAGYI